MIKVKVFAVLKDYFDEILEFDSAESITDIVQLLIIQNPNSKAILHKCRFAINEEFVELETKININDSIFILPPFNGG